MVRPIRRLEWKWSYCRDVQPFGWKWCRDDRLRREFVEVPLVFVLIDEVWPDWALKGPQVFLCCLFQASRQLLDGFFRIAVQSILCFVTNGNLTFFFLVIAAWFVN